MRLGKTDHYTKIVIHVEHEIRQNYAEHEIRNYCSQNCTELKSGSEFNHAINNK